ncbi:MAG: hypothetical protein LUF85_12750 [Bacteroides sp.]|nr:hypothetical protein [Bacteroides sp.]
MKSRKISILLALVTLSSCGPVHFLSRARKVPRDHSVNYNYEHVKSERSEINKQPWVVYSDRQGNVATMEPGGALPQQELGFMEPMLVIGRKGDYYKLIKYDPVVLKNLRLVKHKEAEFYGWLHKDLLLLFNNSLTEIRNGIKLKSLTALTDCEMILEAEKHFSHDSIRVYSDPKLETAFGSVAPGHIVYELKSSDAGDRILLARKTGLTPEGVEEQVVGWVDASLVVPFGQRLALSQPPDVSAGTFVPESSGTRLLPLSHSPVSLSPMLFAHRTDTALLFRTLDTRELIDHSNNRIYNVNGQAITLEQSREIAARLRKVNVIFSFAPSTHVIWQLPILSNAVQNLKPVFEVSAGDFDYRFAATIGGKTISPGRDYLSFSEQVIEACQSVTPGDSAVFVKTLEDALRLASGEPEATNLIVLVGEHSSLKKLPAHLYSGLIRNNCRLMSYQVYADNEDSYNNFVLQSLELIEGYAAFYRKSKQEILVYSDQIRRTDVFLEGAKNVYALDFPVRSMSQGMVVFPEKRRFAETELFIAGVDSMVRQIERDNLTLISSLDKAFAQVGRHRSRFVPEIAAQLGIEPQSPIDPHIGSAFRKTMPHQVTVTERIGLPLDSVSMAPMGLLLTGDELEEVKEFVEKLSSRKPDLKGEVPAGRRVKVRHVKKVRKSLRDIPADLAVTKRDSIGTVTKETMETSFYQSTRKIRKHLRRTYLHALKNCVIEGKPGRLTLARAQEYITTQPTLSPQLGGVTLKGLKKRSRFSDKQLDLLIEYFEESKGQIEALAVPVEEVTSPAGETYFFLPLQALP